jgi:magnesium transporter
MIARAARPARETNAIAAGHESRCLIFTGKDSARALNDPSEISELLRDEQNFVWFDLAEPTAADLALLQEEFSLHPMAVEDASLTHERPKIERFDGYWLTVLHATTLDEHKHLVVHELAVFAGKNFVVTIRAHPVFPIDEIERRWLARGALPHDSTALLYVILDVVVDGYHPVASAYDERLMELESRVVGTPARPEQVLPDVLRFKRELVEFRRAAAPVRDILVPVLRGDLLSLDAAILIYFRDVYDHAARVAEEIDSIRDLLNSTLDIQLSSQAHRQGEVAKQLTLIATIFLPLTYVTGFFGQNFGWMVNRIDGPRPFWLLGIGTQVVALALLVGYFRAKRWS